MFVTTTTNISLNGRERSALRFILEAYRRSNFTSDDPVTLRRVKFAEKYDEALARGVECYEVET